MHERKKCEDYNLQLSFHVMDKERLHMNDICMIVFLSVHKVLKIINKHCDILYILLHGIPYFCT
jgi:hypothetical protein